MTQRDKEFLEDMWKKAEEKEQNMRLAEELTKTPPNTGVNSFLWDLFRGIGFGAAVRRHGRYPDCLILHCGSVHVHWITDCGRRYSQRLQHRIYSGACLICHGVLSVIGERAAESDV